VVSHTCTTKLRRSDNQFHIDVTSTLESNLANTAANGFIHPECTVPSFHNSSSAGSCRRADMISGAALPRKPIAMRRPWLSGDNERQSPPQRQISRSHPQCGRPDACSPQCLSTGVLLNYLHSNPESHTHRVDAAAMVDAQQNFHDVTAPWTVLIPHVFRKSAVLCWLGEMPSLDSFIESKD
jgi:hypothetical protein